MCQPSRAHAGEDAWAEVPDIGIIIHHQHPLSHVPHAGLLSRLAYAPAACPKAMVLISSPNCMNGVRW